MNSGGLQFPGLNDQLLQLAFTKNGMTWPQYWDGGLKGSIATMFRLTAVPHTFTINADGVLQEEHIGDASIE